MRTSTPRRGLAVATLAALLLTVLTTPGVLAADRDRDGLADWFERKYGVTSPDRKDSDWDGVIDAAEDNDGDRLSNLGEQRFGTHPGQPDSDGDGISDGRGGQRPATAAAMPGSRTNARSRPACDPRWRRRPRTSAASRAAATRPRARPSCGAAGSASPVPAGAWC